MAHTLTVTVLDAETKANQAIPLPGFATGETVATMAVVAPVMVTVPVAQLPAVRAEPPIAAVVPVRCGLAHVPAGVQKVVCAIAVAAAPAIRDSSNTIFFIG